VSSGPKQEIVRTIDEQIAKLNKLSGEVHEFRGKQMLKQRERILAKLGKIDVGTVATTTLVKLLKSVNLWTRPVGHKVIKQMHQELLTLIGLLQMDEGSHQTIQELERINAKLRVITTVGLGFQIHERNSFVGTSAQ
jgi:hypothetical protein